MVASNNSPHKFSLIIPTYNREKFIAETLYSALNQEYQNFEILVVDDGSTDSTKDIVLNIIEQNKTIKIKYIYQNNSERGAARNLGTKEANGDYITFLDSDDVLYPNHFTTAAEIVLKQPNIEIFHLGYEVKNNKGQIVGLRPEIKNPSGNQLIIGNFISCNGIFLRREIAKQNLFCEERELALFEDWELWLRLATQYQFQFFNQVTSYINNHDERSVLEVNKDKLISKMNLFLNKVLGNSDVVCYFLKDIKHFKTSCYSYVSLHLALAKKYKIDTLYFLFKTLLNDPLFIFKRRFFVIVKHFF